MSYPWYGSVSGDELEQGDIVLDCPVFAPVEPTDLDALISELQDPHATPELQFDAFRQDVVIVSQTCDLVKGREKLREVLLCRVLRRTEFHSGHFLSNPRELERARRQQYPSYHVLNECQLEGLESDVRVVDFRSIFALPVSFLRAVASRQSPRTRLLPPYREQLGQNFARFFMRVGLPEDIPPFASL